MWPPYLRLPYETLLFLNEQDEFEAQKRSTRRVRVLKVR